MAEPFTPREATGSSEKFTAPRPAESKRAVNPEAQTAGKGLEDAIAGGADPDQLVQNLAGGKMQEGAVIGAVRRPDGTLDTSRSLVSHGDGANPERAHTNAALMVDRANHKALYGEGAVDTDGIYDVKTYPDGRWELVPSEYIQPGSAEQVHFNITKQLDQLMQSRMAAEDSGDTLKIQQIDKAMTNLEGQRGQLEAGVVNLKVASRIAGIEPPETRSGVPKDLSAVDMDELIASKLEMHQDLYAMDTDPTERAGREKQIADLRNLRTKLLDESSRATQPFGDWGERVTDGRNVIDQVSTGASSPVPETNSPPKQAETNKDNPPIDPEFQQIEDHAQSEMNAKIRNFQIALRSFGLNTSDLDPSAFNRLEPDFIKYLQEKGIDYQNVPGQPAINREELRKTTLDTAPANKPGSMNRTRVASDANQAASAGIAAELLGQYESTGTKMGVQTEIQKLEDQVDALSKGVTQVAELRKIKVALAGRELDVIAAKDVLTSLNGLIY